MFSPAATGRCCSSTIIRRTAPPRWRARSARPTAGCAACAASAAAASPAPASKACWRARPATSRCMDADLQHDESLPRRHARAPARRQLRPRGGEPLPRRRLRRRAVEAARPRQPLCQHAGAPAARHRSHRSDERPFHDPARRLRAAGAGDFLARLQDSARHSGDQAAAACASSSCRRAFTSAATAKASSTARSRSTLPRC